MVVADTTRLNKFISQSYAKAGLEAAYDTRGCIYSGISYFGIPSKSRLVRMNKSPAEAGLSF